MCHEANSAARGYLERGRISSASVMLPCPWADQFLAWSREHPDHDIGVHLTLTSEWTHYRWGPVTSRSEVPGLVDGRGHLWPSREEVERHASVDEVRREIRAQVEAARAAGLEPTHVDAHMGALLGRRELVDAYLSLAEELGIPAMMLELTPAVLARFREQGYPLDESTVNRIRAYPLPKLDALVPIPKGDSYEQVRERTLAMLDGLPPGITQIIFHPSAESEALKDITASWAQRVWEGRLFDDPQVVERLARDDVVVTDWRELMRRFRETTSPRPSPDGRR